MTTKLNRFLFNTKHYSYGCLIILLTAVLNVFFYGFAIWLAIQLAKTAGWI